MRWAATGAVALTFILIPFWDWLPIVVAHHHYCANEAKFIVHKSLDRWKQENKEAAKNLLYNRDARITKVGDFRRFPLNQRLASESKGPTPVFLAVRRYEGRIVDVLTGEVLVEYVDFQTGYPPAGLDGGSWKGWLNLGSCKDVSKGSRPFGLIEREVVKMGGGT